MENGTIINQYKIISAIGKGGMGEVFLAQDTKLNRKVALKILPPEFAEDLDRMSRFVREAQSASALNHPNILTIHEIGESDGTHFIATEFIDGKTLNDYAKSNPLNFKSALEIAIQVVSALDEAHSAGIVHRDIKPDNIMIRANGLAKILDFGIAKLSAPTETGEEAATAIQSQTQAGMIIGTPNYMSPEQARGKGVDHQTDIFSFGVVLYEMLSGSSPFAGETISDIIAAVLTKEPKPLADIPIELADIVDKTLQKDKQNRYQTAKDLLHDLKEVKQELEIQSRLGRNSAPNLEEPKTQILKAQTTAESETQNSIAVMPFTNMSADEDNEYFCDGLAEELLNALSKIDELKVAARTSAFSFKGKNANVSEIGEKLSVKNVLEGSVRKSGNRLRISVQLVNAADGYQLWSERYDREMEDIFDVQDEIALAVVDALKLKLFGDEKAAVLKRGTNNAEAYELYLKGRFYFSKFTAEGFTKSVEYYEQALAIEPDYAPAFAALSSSYICSWYLGFGETAKCIYEAKAAADKALALDHLSAEAYFALALTKFNYERDWTEAEKAFQRAKELNPNYAENYEHYSIFLAVMERSDEAVAEAKRAIELAPLALSTIYLAGWGFWFAGQSDLAKEQGEKLLDMEPNFSGGHTHLGVNFWGEREYEKSRIALETAVKLGGGNDIKMLLGLLYGIIGEREKANGLLTEFQRLDEQGIFTANQQAFVCAGLGEMDRAFDLLEQAAERHEGVLVFLKQFSSLFPEFHNDSRMTDLLNRIGLPTDKTNQTDESLEAKTVMLRAGEATSEPSAKDLETENAETKPTTEPATNAKSEIQKPKSKWWLYGLLSLIIIIGGFFGYKYFTPNKQIESIAVMPFVNDSGNSDVEYLSDGMTETLIKSLSNLPNLNVKPRSSVFRYKGKDTDLQTIAKELNVQAILNGKVVQRGNDVSLYVELIDISLDKVIWSETYNRKQNDLVTLQSDIARDVSNKLKIKLSSTDETKVTKTYTTNAEAYQLYLKGRYHYAKLTKDDIFKGIEYFQKAIENDSNFAMAYVGVADSYNAIPSFNYLSPKESIPKAKMAAQRALEIDPTLAEAHTALATSIVEYDWDWEKAEREFKRALELNPNVANTHFLYGLSFLVPMKRTAEAIVEIKRAAELEPLNVDIGANLAAAYMYDRQFERALEQAQKNYDLDPNFVGGRIWLATMYNINGKYAEAIAICEKSLRNDPTNPPFLTLAGYAYAKNGQRQEAEQIVKRWQEVAKTQYVSRYWIAVVYDGLGKRDEAFAELEKAHQEHDYFMPRLKVDPFLDSLRDDPRFKDLLKRMNLPE